MRKRAKLKRRSKLRRKLDKEVIDADIVDVLPDGVVIPEGGPKVIKRYPDQECAVKGCTRKAVGSGDVCKKHGGKTLVRENLVPSDVLPPAVVGTTYDAAVHPMQFVELARGGMSEVEIAAEIGVSVHTLRGWSEKFSEFNSAYEIGQALHEAWWLKQGKDNLDNRGYNVGLFKFLTGNKLGYSDKMESKNLHVHAGVLQVPGAVSEDEWEKKHAKTD